MIFTSYIVHSEIANQSGDASTIKFHRDYNYDLSKTDNWRKTDYRGANITPKKEEYKSKTQLEAAVANNKQYCGADEIDMYKRVKLAEKYMENRKAILEMESSDDEN